MKLLVKLPDGDLYGAGDKRYIVRFWEIGYQNFCGETFNAIVTVFTSNGWVELFRHEQNFNYKLPRKYTDEEKDTIEKARKEFRDQILMWVTAFNDG